VAKKPLKGKSPAPNTVTPKNIADRKRRKTATPAEERVEDTDEEDEEDVGDESYRLDPLEEGDDEDESDASSDDGISSTAATPVSELRHPYGRTKGAQSTRGSSEEEQENNPTNGRPKRNRIKPVAFWNGEKVEYKVERRLSGSLQLPSIKNVIRVTPSRLERGGRTGVPKGKGGKAGSPSSRGFQQVEVPRVSALDPATGEEEEMGIHSFHLCLYFVTLCTDDSGNITRFGHVRGHGRAQGGAPRQLPPLEGPEYRGFRLGISDSPKRNLQNQQEGELTNGWISSPLSPPPPPPPRESHSPAFQSCQKKGLLRCQRLG